MSNIVDKLEHDVLIEIEYYKLKLVKNNLLHLTDLTLTNGILEDVSNDRVMGAERKSNIEKANVNEIVKLLFSIKLLKKRYSKSYSNIEYLMFIELYGKVDFFVNLIRTELLKTAKNGEKEAYDLLKLYHMFHRVDKRITNIIFCFKEDKKLINSLKRKYKKYKILN